MAVMTHPKMNKAISKLNKALILVVARLLESAVLHQVQGILP